MLWSYCTLPHFHSPPPPTSHGCKENHHPLEWVVLGGDLADEVVAENGHLAHNVLAHAGDLGEEEEGEESGYTAETGCDGATAIACQLFLLCFVFKRRGRDPMGDVG